MPFHAKASYRDTTTKVRTPLGALYVIIARDDAGTIVRLMAHCGKEPTGGVWCDREKAEHVSHPQVNSLLDCICHLTRKLIKSGVPERVAASKLMGYDEGWPDGYYFPASMVGVPAARVRSLQDAIGRVMIHDAEAQKNGGAGASTESPGGEVRAGETDPAPPSIPRGGDHVP